MAQRTPIRRAETATERGTKRQRLGEARWRELIAEQAGSGLSAAAFCRERGLSSSTFYYWRRRIREERGTAPDASEPRGFVRVESTVSSSKAVEAELPCGTKVRVPGAQLAELVHALRQEGPRC